MLLSLPASYCYSVSQLHTVPPVIKLVPAGLRVSVRSLSGVQLYSNPIELRRLLN